MKRLLIVLLMLNLLYLLVQQLWVSEESPAEEAQRLSVSAGRSDTQLIDPSVPQWQSAVTTGDTGEAEGATESESEAEPEPEPEPEPDAGVVLPLVSGAAPAETPDSTDAETVNLQQNLVSAGAVAAQSAGASSGCLILGPFREERAAARALKAVDEHVVDAEMTDRDSKLLPDYVVYVGPEERIELARSKAAVFEKEGIDSQVIGSGVLKNTVSLGVFSRKPLATSLVERLVARGHEPKLRLIDRNRRGYQVRGTFGPGARRLLTAGDFPFIECPGPP